MLMDILGGVISGAGYAGGVRNQFLDYDEPQNVGHFFLALKPDLFISRTEFNSRMKTLGERWNAVTLAHEFEEILMPGELEKRREDERRANGVSYNVTDEEAVTKEAAKKPEERRAGKEGVRRVN